MAQDEKINLTKNLQELSNIADWFDEQEEIDVEEGLKKVKEAAGLIKESKARLLEIENEFEEIKKEIEVDTKEDIESDKGQNISSEGPTDDLPF